MKTKYLLCLALFLAMTARSAFGQLVISANLSGVVNAPIDQNGWQSFKVNLTQNITFNFVVAPPAPLPAQSTLRVIFTQDATGGRTVTFASNIANPCTITANANSTTTCQFTFDGTTSTWQGVGGSGGGISSGSTVIDAAAAPYNAVFDGQICQDITISGAPLRTITSASQCTWTAAVNGSEVGAWAVSCNTNGPGHQTNLFAANTTVTFVSAHVLLASATAVSNGACVIVAHNTDAALTLVDTAIKNSTACPTVVLPQGRTYIDMPHFTNGAIVEPVSCNSTEGLGGASAGNGFGLVIQGQGPGTTTLTLGAGFAANMATKCINGTLTSSCFYVPFGGMFRNFTISGGGESLFGVSPGTHALLEIGGYAELSYVNFLNYGSASSSANAVAMNQTGAPVYWEHTIFDGFGTQVNINSGVGLIMDSSTVEDYNFGSMILCGAGSVIRMVGYNYLLPGGLSPANQKQLEIASGSPGCQVTGSGMLSVVGPNGDVNAFTCVILDGAGALFSVDNLRVSNSGGVAGNSCINNNGGTVYAHNWNIAWPAGGNSGYSSGASTSIGYDEGGNTIGGNPAFNIAAGVWIAQGRQVNGACTGVATASSTIGLRISGSSTTGTAVVTACTNSAVIDAGQIMQSAGTLQVLQVGASAAGVNASSGVVTVLKNGSATAITCTIGTGTSCSDGTHSVAFVVGDRISLQFTTQAADTLAGVTASVALQGT